MKTKAVRLYGENDLRLEEFTLPPMQEDQMLARIVSDSICMSSYKAAIQGAAHKRVPDDVSDHPIIVGHEFCGEILQVGDKWKHLADPGDRFAIQPALNYKGSLAAPGYSYQHIGGAATCIVIPNEVMEQGCLLPYCGEAFFYGSLAEPMSCIVGAFHANYHTQSGSYVHSMGIVDGGTAAILGGAGPMGLGAIDYAIHRERRPRLVVVTDIDDGRLAHARKCYPEAEAREFGVELHYVNTAAVGDPKAKLMALTDGKGFNDVFVFAPVKPVIEFGDSILARDGCMNFFAGPTNSDFKAEMNFYNVHYNSTHIVGTSGGNTDDMKESLELMASGAINPAAMITHVGGLDSVVQTTLNLPKIPGGKKLIYTGISMDLTAIADFGDQDNSPMGQELARIVAAHNGLWSAEAEAYLLANAQAI